MEKQDGRWMIWPERRFVLESEAVRWANDLLTDDGQCQEALCRTIEES